MKARPQPTASPADPLGALPVALPVALLVVLAITSLWAIATELPRVLAEQGLWDFGAFLESGRAAAAGLDPYGIYPLTPHVVLPGFEAWNPNLNPPVSALLFQLFDLGPPETARRVWQWISVACYAATVLLLLRRYGGGPRADRDQMESSDRVNLLSIHMVESIFRSSSIGKRSRVRAAVLGLWAFALAGFWDTLFLGQIYLPLVLAAVAAWLLLERGEFLGSAILIGIVVAMKPNFLVWPVLLFLSGYRLPAVVSLATAAVISAIPLVLFGPEIYWQWIGLVLSDESRAFFLTNASLSGLAARAGLPAAGLVASLLLLLGLAAWCFRQRPPVLRASALALVAAVLASPLGWIHYTLFLLPVLLHHFHRRALWPVAVLLAVPVPFVIAQFAKPVWIQLTLGSIYGWALVLCLVVLLLVEGREARASSGVLAR